MGRQAHAWRGPASAVVSAPFWAAMPAVTLGLWLLCLADAPRSAQTMQVAVLAVAVLVHAATVWVRGRWSVSAPRWMALPLALSLFIPVMVAAPGEPARWLVLGSARLYLAPLVLPPLVLLLAASGHALARYVATATAATAALVLQPDAPQMTAFALALLVVLAADDGARSTRLVLFAVLLSGAIVGWRAPDPLTPVRYVEGVFSVAAATSPWVLAAATASAVLPVATLAWVAHRLRSRGTCAVAVYFGALFALAPWQVTPVPLLGFGSGPILGYFFVAGIVSPRRARHRPAPEPGPATSTPDRPGVFPSAGPRPPM